MSQLKELRSPWEPGGGAFLCLSLVLSLSRPQIMSSEKPRRVLLLIFLRTYLNTFVFEREGGGGPLSLLLSQIVCVAKPKRVRLVIFFLQIPLWRYCALKSPGLPPSRYLSLSLFLSFSLSFSLSLTLSLSLCCSQVVFLEKPRRARLFILVQIHISTYHVLKNRGGASLSQR